MAPRGLAILLGAGPATGAGIARVLADPHQGNLAVALLARNPTSLAALRASLLSTLPPGAVIEAFPTDTSPASLDGAFAAIADSPALSDLRLALAVYNVKHASRAPFLEVAHADFVASLAAYVGGAFAFAQRAVARFLADHPEGDDGGADAGLAKRGTLVFTGTLGALRCSAGYAAYGAGRAGVRQLAQSLAREFSERGVHVVHAVANGGIEDDAAPREEGEGGEDVGGETEGRVRRKGRAQAEGRKMSAESVGRTYLWLEEQPPDLWTHELDMRPAMEKF